MAEPKLRFKEENGVQFPDWEEKTFNDIADYKKGPFGSALKKKIFVPKSNSTVKVYEQQNAISKDWRLERYFVTDEYFQANLKSFSVSGGDIIVSCAGTIGEVYELPNDAEEGIINQALMRVRIKKSVINSMVFKCVFDKMISSEGIKISNGSALKNIPPFADMKKQPVFLPSLPEQQKISSLFTELDALIQSAENELEGYRELKQGMLQKMFPKNGEKAPEIRFPEFTDDWEQRKLSELATMHARIGWQNLRTSEFLDTGDYMLITGTDFEDGRVNYSTCHYVEKERYDQDKNIQIKNGSILITKDGTLGKVAYVEGLNMPATLNAGVFNIEVRDENETDGKYLFQFLRAPFLMNYVAQKVAGSTIKHLNQNILVDFPISMPSKEEQKKIGEYFQNLDNLIASQEQELDGYKELKKGLLQQMFC